MFGFEVRNYYDVDCFFMMNDGRFIVAEYNGCRVSTHFELFLKMNDIFPPTDSHEWESRQEKYQLIRIVPECNFMIMSQNQILTTEQQIVVDKLIDEYNFTIEYYQTRLLYN